MDRLLLEYFDDKPDRNLPISRKMLMKKSSKIAADLGLEKFKGSKGYVHRLIRSYAIVPRSLTGSGQQIPHYACAMATQHTAEIGELQLQLGIPPRAGRNSILDETPNDVVVHGFQKNTCSHGHKACESKVNRA